MSSQIDRLLFFSALTTPELFVIYVFMLANSGIFHNIHKEKVTKNTRSFLPKEEIIQPLLDDNSSVQCKQCGEFVKQLK